MATKGEGLEEKLFNDVTSAIGRVKLSPGGSGSFSMSALVPDTFSISVNSS
jgi:hypothetical protein